MFTVENIFLIYVHTNSYVHAQMCGTPRGSQRPTLVLSLRSCLPSSRWPSLTHAVGLCAANPGVLHSPQSPQYRCPSTHVELRRHPLGFGSLPLLVRGDGTRVVKAHRLCGFYPPSNLARTSGFFTRVLGLEPRPPCLHCGQLPVGYFPSPDFFCLALLCSFRSSPLLSLTTPWGRELAQWLDVLVALPEDPGSNPAPT